MTGDSSVCLSGLLVVIKMRLADDRGVKEISIDVKDQKGDEGVVVVRRNPFGMAQENERLPSVLYNLSPFDLVDD